MLRTSDLLLTLAAIFLLDAALRSGSKANRFVTQASANQVDQRRQQQLTSDSGSEFSANHVRHRTDAQVGDQMQTIDHWMSKIQRNLGATPKKLTIDGENDLQEAKTRQRPRPNVTAPDEPARAARDSYNFYADETNDNQQVTIGQQKQQQPQPVSSSDGDRQQVSQYRQAQEVKVDFLRSNVGSPAKPTGSSDSAKSFQNASSSSKTLFLLNYQLLPHSKTSKVVDANPAALPEIESNEIIEPREQQQQPPFTLFPPLQQNAGGIANQQPLQQPNIRQVLSNYQRYPQAQQMPDHQRQLLTQLQPGPRELHLRPPTQAPALGLANPLGQSPLQLLAGPFQAFLPGLAGQQEQQPQANGVQVMRQPGARDSKYDAGGDGEGPKAPTPTAPQQQQNPFGAFLNPFNLQPPATQAPSASGQQSAGQAGGLQNLQNFYQQLPLYQALLAARQRQEALQAAQKLRDEQQQRQNQVNGNQVGNPLLGLIQLNNGGAQPTLPPPQTNAIENTASPPAPPPFARLPFGLPPAQGVSQLNQQAPNAIGQSPWAPQLQQQLPTQPYAPAPAPPLQPAHGQAQQPVSNQNGPVHFDDEVQNNQLPQQPQQNLQQHHQQNQQHQQPQQPYHQNQQQQQPQPQQPPVPVNNNQEHENGNDDNQQNSHNDDHGQNDHGNGNNHNDNQDHGNNHDNGGHGQDHNGNRPAEEEDPDLKSFQNLANGGDSFTDLFPKGILSDGDINEIKTQQAEQAKKQEEKERQEERQRQQQQERQQQPQYNNQPINQFAGNGLNNQNNYQNNQQPNLNQYQQPRQQQNEDQGNQAQNDDQPEDQDGGNQEGNDDGQEEGNQDDGSDDGGGENEDGGQGEDSPTAAALTQAKSDDNKSSERWTKSPGVEYVKKN